ncbi:DUF6624 domain-containing protein [Mangrovivirga cuniculi]|uniref:Tetratricopeptide repeat-containing protein n=1 Tax=Mangrovivirga cuniculi TaxID=2715131 RepID=A0A4D7JUX2_9BACT|nr:DUF6624 domain-containing protein [Mangrovivirga cuniculi]QCK16382.1 hypothetical protein DCC35_17390 [Mangrovivirga cuniculi]
MKNLLTLIILSFIANPVFSQSFDELISQAGEKYDNEEYVQSANLYEKALSKKSGTASQNYNAACSFALAGNEERAFYYLEKSTDAGYKAIDWMKRDKDLTSLHDNENWEKIVDKVLANKAEYEKDFDKELQAQLERIYVEDQTLRHLLGPAEEKFGRGSENMAYIWGLMSKEDDRLLKEVVSIIEKHGWVGRSEVGGKANAALWLVIQHAPLEVQEKYIPLLEESVKKGESSGSHLALLVDRIEMRNGRPQIYGSQITSDSETGESRVYDLVDPQNVNSRRAEVGLGPLEEYARRFGVEWSPSKTTSSFD